MRSRRPDPGQERLRTPPAARFGDLAPALERIGLPMVEIGRDGIVGWQNAAARTLTGDLRGRRYLHAFAPESRPRTEREFARTLLGSADGSDYEAVMLRADGSRVRVEISSAPIDVDGRVLGVFGAVVVARAAGPEPAALDELTPRQAEVLRLLAGGASTEQIQDTLHVSRETARNHVRSLLRRLGVHSRLEAVVVAHRRGLLD